MATPSTSQLNTNVTIKVKVLSVPEKRKSKYGGQSVVFSCIDSNSKDVKEVFAPDVSETTFKIGKFYLLRNVVVGSYVRISANTKIMQCTKFDFPKETEESFYRPKEVSVAEALRSPNKRRLSVTGTLSDESDIKESGGVKRKILKLTTSDQTLDIKLWGDQVNRPHPPIGSDVLVTCVKVNEYKGQTEVNATSMTEIKELCTESTFSGVVEAADFDFDSPTIMLNGNEDLLRLTRDQLLDIFPNEEIEEGVNVKGKKRGLHILTINRIEDLEAILLEEF